jgi:hypothetical protein
MKELALLKLKSKNNLDSTLESPFCEKKGLLEFKEGFTDPGFFARWSFVTNLYGEQVFLDHCVLTFPERQNLENYAENACLLSGHIVEGPGVFPIEFCPNTYTLTTDLWMHFLTILMPSGGLLVLNAPYAAGDEKDRFIKERGQAAVHHVAIRVDDVHAAALLWQRKGFQPLSLEPLDGGTLCQWFLQNSAGQIIELIGRRPDNKATFHCQNIGGLRLAEVAG